MSPTQDYIATSDKESGIQTKSESDCNAHVLFMQYYIASASIIIKVNQVNLIFSTKWRA